VRTKKKVAREDGIGCRPSEARTDRAEEKRRDSCNEDPRPIGEETSERYEYIPAQLLGIEDIRKKHACACTVKTAGKPPQPIEKSAPGSS
jgi:hypothetical protein